jgi:hypothetical protein
MKSPNCSATALSLTCIERRGRLTAGAVSGLWSEAAVRSPPRGANFRAYSRYRGQQRTATLRAAKCHCCRGVAWRHERGGMALGVRRRLGSRCLKAPVAQLDRALPSEGRGHRFESCRVRQTNMLILLMILC